jgi:hypothetical protein
MPVYHLFAAVITKGKTAGGAAGFRAYMDREKVDQASQMRRYMDRENGREDLVAKGAANLPQWAKSADHFWRMADTYERQGWVVARTVEIALPRELPRAAQLELADDIREVIVGKFAHSWAVHEPMAADGEPQPHIHIMYSPRREDVALDRTPAQWFAKAAARDRNPLEGGVRKDPLVEKKAWLYDVREAVALLQNAAMHREGLVAAVDHRSLEARGLSRDPARYDAGNQADMARTQAYRAHLKESQRTIYEDLQAYRGWQKKALEHLDRQHVIEMTRNHLWRYDQSPARIQERIESRQRQGRKSPTVERTKSAVSLAQARERVRAVLQGLGREEEPTQGGALRVRLFDREEEQERGVERGRGMGW